MNKSDFATIMRGLLPADAAPPRVAVAVSGGGDSMALALLVHGFVTQAGGQMLALTVDHGLRPGARAEAEAAGKTLAARGIAHRILTWQGDKPATHIQERARAARYRLLAEACRAENMQVLCVAHNLEDQMETFWMRLAHGSGLDGLAAMAPVRLRKGLRIIRPLLAVPRAALRDYCRGEGIEWAEDPSNANGKYLRVKLRQFEYLLAAEGLTPARLSRTLQKLAAARDALQSVATAAFSSCVTLHSEGYATIARPGFAALHAEIQRRVLARAIAAVAPQPYPLGADAVEDALDDMLSPGFAGRTLAGAEFSVVDDTQVLLTREVSAMAEAPFCAGMVWDGRFAVQGFPAESAAASAAAFPVASLAVAPLGEDGVAALRKILKEAGAEGMGASKRFEILPAKVRRGLPAVRDGKKLLCVPHVSWVAPLAAASLGALRFDYCPGGTAP